MCICQGLVSVCCWGIFGGVVSIINNVPVNDTRLVSLTNGAKRRGESGLRGQAPSRHFRPLVGRRIAQTCTHNFITDCSQRAWLTGDLTNHNTESAILSDKQIRQENRLSSVDLKMVCIDVFPRLNKIRSDVHSCLFHALSKCEKTIDSRAAAWTEAIQPSVTTH